MGEKIRVVYYLNQFFGQVGGEDKAEMAPELVTGTLGPGLVLEKLLADEAEIVATVIAGDNYMAKDLDKATSEIIAMLKGLDFDLFLAGPAFLAGRYGIACGAICQAVSEKTGRPAAAAMSPENPGADQYKSKVFIAPSANSAADMRKALPKLAQLGLKLAKGQTPDPNAGEYILQGRRVNVFAERRGAARAMDMLIAKLNGEPFETELPMPQFDKVAPAPAVADLSKATLMLVTTGGIMPLGNPGSFSTQNSKKWGLADIEGIDDFEGGKWDVIHAGYDNTFASEDPDRVVPLDVAAEAERRGRIGRLFRQYAYTVGNGTQVDRAVRFGQEIAAFARDNGVNAVVMTST